MSFYKAKTIYALLASFILLNSACSAAHTTSATTAVSPSPAIASVPPGEAPKVPRVTVEELKKLLADNKAVVVDVRSIDAYNIGHIKGSISLPLDKIEAGEFKSLPRDKQLVTYCSCPAENSSSAAADLLEKAGFKNLGVLLGGTTAWESSGGEMEKGSTGGKS